jgi:hypothetical protein
MGDPGTKWPYPRIAAGPEPQSVSGPMVLVSWHMGAYETLGAFLARLPGEVLSLRMSSGGSTPGITRVAVGGLDEWQRVQVTKRAVTTLRAGGFVFLAIDGPGSSFVEMEVFGGSVFAAAGAFALAKLAGAPMVPITARWRGDKVDVIVGEAIPPGDPSTMAAALGRWLEGYLRENPRELRWPLIRNPPVQSNRVLLQQNAQAGVANLAVLGPGYRPPGEKDYPAGRESEGSDYLPGDVGNYLLG